jgi:hypothetical protein
VDLQRAAHIRSRQQRNIDTPDSDKITWLANQIFSAFPKEDTGLKFYALDCGCIYYHRVYKDGDLDLQIGIYRDAEEGPCEICLAQTKAWENKVVDQNVVYNTRFQIERI